MLLQYVCCIARLGMSKGREKAMCRVRYNLAERTENRIDGFFLSFLLCHCQVVQVFCTICTRHPSFGPFILDVFHPPAAAAADYCVFCFWDFVVESCWQTSDVELKIYTRWRKQTSKQSIMWSWHLNSNVLLRRIYSTLYTSYLLGDIWNGWFLICGLLLGYTLLGWPGFFLGGRSQWCDLMH